MKNLEQQGVTLLPGRVTGFEIPAVTDSGRATILFIEAVPDGILDTFKGIKTSEAFEERMRITVEDYFPEIAARITPASLWAP